MKASVDTENILYSLAYMVLPMSVLDSFDLVSVEEEQNPKDTDILYPTILHLSLDEKDNRGDTRVELPTRSRNLLTKNRDKWTDSQKKRAKILFEEYPRIKEVYEPVNRLGCVFKNKEPDKGHAQE